MLICPLERGGIPKMLKKTERQLEKEARAYCSDVIEPKIKSGEIDTRLDMDKGFPLLSGKAGGDDVYLCLRTTRGDVTVLLDEDDVYQLEAQFTDLSTYFDIKRDELDEERASATLN
jgi:hypothetical protein